MGHQYYTGAHELCHLLYHKHLERYVCNVGLYDSRAPMERESDSFAGQFLVPDAALEYLVSRRLGTRKSLSIADGVFLEQYFQVSHSVMLIRLEQLGLIDKAQSEDWKPGIIRTARELGYDTSLYKPTGISSTMSDYAEKAKKALDEGLISRGKYEELLLEAELHSILFDEEGEDE
ncbi:MAG: ImmA/IrrE family metallo-endopeptidase [Candidatus Desulforudis sp.]|nr:ImmA/IrrE family metallo-endopeptidase [Desulforudis sp.]